METNNTYFELLKKYIIIFKNIPIMRLLIALPRTVKILYNIKSVHIHLLIFILFHMHGLKC